MVLLWICRIGLLLRKFLHHYVRHRSCRALRFEIQRGPKIGMGFFSEVFQGKWEGRTVAVKVLSEVTPSDLFIREIKVWKSLRHPNVLKLYGASSATGNPPWFFVSPYMKHGNLAEFLRRISRQDQADLVGLGTIVENLPSSKSRGCFGMGNFRLLKMDDTYRMLQEIAKAMEYLHLKGILHGDLKVNAFLFVPLHDIDWIYRGVQCSC